jgi:hypothetical protein
LGPGAGQATNWWHPDRHAADMRDMSAASTALPFWIPNPLPGLLPGIGVASMAQSHQQTPRRNTLTSPALPQPRSSTHPRRHGTAQQDTTHDTTPRCTDNVYIDPIPSIRHHTPRRHYTTYSFTRASAAGNVFFMFFYAGSLLG